MAVATIPARRTLRVLHLRNSDLLGGPEQLILGECTHAGSNLSPVIASFVTRGRPSAFLAEAERRGLEQVAVEQRGSFDPRVPARLRRLLDAVRPDVVVGHDYKANHVLRRTLRRRSTPQVAVVHGYTAENRKVRFFERLDRRHLRGVEAVVAVSDAMVADLRAAGVAPERLHVVPNAIDVDAVQHAAAAARDALRARWGVGDGGVLVLALGRLSPEKGGDVLLEAFARACVDRSDPTRLLFVGDGASRAALEARAGRPDLEGRVIFAGWRDDPWACLGAADLFVLPSHREGMPLALLEALAAGLPVVATGVGSVPRVLDDGRLGTLVPPGDVDALAAALRAHLDGSVETPSAAFLRAHARDRYAVEARTRRLEGVLADIVAPRETS